MAHTWKLLLAVLLISGAAWSQVMSGTGPVSLPTYYAAIFGVYGDGSHNDCTALTNAMSIVSTAGGGYIDLPYGHLTKLTTCDPQIPSNVILRGSGNVGWTVNTGLAPPPSGLHLTNTGSSSVPILNCLSAGMCGLENMTVVNDANNRPFMLYTAGIPWLQNVLFRGETPGNSSGHESDRPTGAICPDNDGIYFGTAGQLTCSSGSTSSDFCGYGANHIYGVYFQNIRQAMVLSEDANGLNLHVIEGDDSDAYPSGYFIYASSSAPTNQIYGNIFDGVAVEQAQFNYQSGCGYKGAVGLNTNVVNNMFVYSTSDVGTCAHSMDILQSSSVRNKITVLAGGVSGIPVNDVNGASTVNNSVEDLTKSTLAWQTTTTKQIIFGPYTVSGMTGLPSGAAYEIAWVSDSNTGDCTTGGGTIKVLCFYDGTGWKPLGNLFSPTFTSPNLGAAAATSLSVSGVLDGHDAVYKDTTTTVTVGSSYQREYHFNQHATASQAILYNLPAAAAGKKYCFFNCNNGSAANTGTLKLQTSGITQYVIGYDGTLSSADGYVISGGGAGDAGCVEGLDNTHWQLYSYRGTWTAH